MISLDPNLLLGGFALVNVWTFMLFGFDKLRAEAGSWRIAESTLLGFAFFGGIGGAYVGRRTFRHKTRKQPFSNQLHTIAIGQALISAAGIGYWLG